MTAKVSGNLLMIRHGHVCPCCRPAPRNRFDPDLCIAMSGEHGWDDLHIELWSVWGSKSFGRYLVFNTIHVIHLDNGWRLLCTDQRFPK